jgi:protein gp37
MNKSKIEWCDRTWNPITGCLHGCEYCYARGIARRFGDNKSEDLSFLDANFTFDTSIKPTNPYPFGFRPTFHRYRLDYPTKIKTPQTIFVGSMADVFGDWVPDEWIAEVFKACEAAPHHRYIFLTKNPKRYAEIIQYFPNAEIWLGSTITSRNDDPLTDGVFWNTFVSVEPILENVIDNLSNALPRWVIIGAETGTRNPKTIPKREWIDDIVSACRQANIPVFLKNNLADIWGEPLIQELPWGVHNTNE